MKIQPICTDHDYRATLREIETLMSAESGSPKGDRSDALVTLVEAWEHQQHPMEPPDPGGADRARA